MNALKNYSDEDVRRTVMNALRLVIIATVIAVPLVWWKFGWSTALLLVVGAGISGSGLWEWRKLMTSMMAYMDAGGEAKPIGPVLAGFFLRLGLAIAVLYVSLKFLNGSVFALAAGLGLGILSLTFEAIKLARTWTV